jgi:hypothetical protein
MSPLVPLLKGLPKLRVYCGTHSSGRGGLVVPGAVSSKYPWVVCGGDPLTLTWVE